MVSKEQVHRMQNNERDINNNRLVSPQVVKLGPTQ